MTTTSNWLQDADASQLAFTLVFDGIDLAITTASNTSEMVTAYSATDWTNIVGGLSIVGTVSQKLEVFDPSISPSTLSFRTVDVDEEITSQLLRVNSSEAHLTYLQSSLAPSFTASMTVRSTTGFDNSGHVYIGQECIAYTGKTATTFTTLTRGKFAIWGTQSTSGRFGRYHRAAYTNRSITQAVTDEPRNWYNRMVALYVHHYENGAWSTKANAKMVWAGRLKEYQDSGDGTIDLSCLSIHEVLSSTVFAGQYVAKLPEGMKVSAVHRGVAVQCIDGGATHTLDLTHASTALTTGQRTAHDIVSDIQLQFRTYQNAGTIPSAEKWNIAIENTTEGLRTVIQMETTVAVVAITPGPLLALHPKVWQVLGFDGTGTRVSISDSHVLEGRHLGRTSSARTRFRLESNHAPIVYWDVSKIYPGETFVATDVSGAWVTQDGYLPSEFRGSDGFVKVNDNILAVDYSSNTFTVNDYYSARTFNRMESGVRPVYMDASNNPPEVKQMFIERDTAGEVLLRLMLSTGSNSYNHSTYDLPQYATTALALPYELIDVESFEGIESDYELALDGPKPFREILEGILASENRYVVFRDGQLTVTPPGFDSSKVEDVIEVDETTKATPDDRSTISYSAEGMVNRITLKWQDSRTGEWDTQTIEDVRSISDFGQRRSVVIEAKGVRKPKHWATYTAAPALAYFARPLGIITRTFNAKLVHLVPGDIVKLTDNALVDPREGTRGVAGLACWVAATEFDWSTGKGRMTLVFLPEHAASRYAKYSPSALVSSYDAGTKVLTLASHGFSRSTDSIDSSQFSIGDKVHVYMLDDETSPQEWSDTVAAVGTDTLTMTTGLGGFSGSAVYVVEADEINTVVTAQRDNAFIADDSDMSTGYADDDANFYAGTVRKTSRTSSVTYTNQHVKPAASGFALGTAGEPLSTHKIWHVYDNCNNFLAYKSRNILVSDPYFVSAIGGGIAGIQYLAYGPIFLPLYGVSDAITGVRTISVKVFWRVTAGATTGTVTYTTSAAIPKGTANSTLGASPLTFPAKKSQNTDTTTGTSFAWSNETEITPVVTFHNGMPCTWFTTEIVASGAGSVEMRGIVVVEKELT